MKTRQPLPACAGTAFEFIALVGAGGLLVAVKVKRARGQQRLSIWLHQCRLPRLIITPRVCEVICRDGRQQIAPIHWQSIRGMCLGTSRPIFGCPCCSHHTFKLYDVFGELYCWKCAFARGVRYASQQLSRKGRQYLQSQRLRRFLGEYPSCSTIHKPLFMHRKTYSALLNRLRQIEAKPENRTYKSKRLTAATLKPNNMYRVQLAAVGERINACPGFTARAGA